MASSIECPACDESFPVADDVAGKKVTCPGCGNISRVPGATKPPRTPPASNEKDTSVAKNRRRKSRRQAAAQRSPEDPSGPPPAIKPNAADETPQAPPAQPPPIKTLAIQTDIQPSVSDASSPVVSINRETTSTSTATGERRTRRKKKSPILLWGVILGGGFGLIGLVLGANFYQQWNHQNKRPVVKNNKDPEKDDKPVESRNTPGQGNPKQKNPVQPEDQGAKTLPDQDSFESTVTGKELVDDKLIKQFRESGKTTPSQPQQQSSSSTFTPGAVAILFNQCQDLQWKPETLSDYAKLQGLAKLLTDCGRAQDSQLLEADQKEDMLKAALNVMETLATTSWGDQAQVTRTNKLATEALQNQQELGIFIYSEVYIQASRQLDGAKVIFFKLIGTDQHVAVTAKENSGPLIPGSRWLILGECNFLRTVQLRDGDTGNTIKAPLVTAYYVIEKPK